MKPGTLTNWILNEQKPGALLTLDIVENEELRLAEIEGREASTRSAICNRLSRFALAGHLTRISHGCYTVPTPDGWQETDEKTPDAPVAETSGPTPACPLDDLFQAQDGRCAICGGEIYSLMHARHYPFEDGQQITRHLCVHLACREIGTGVSLLEARQTIHVAHDSMVDEDYANRALRRGLRLDTEKTT